MKSFRADYAVYKGATYREKLYHDKTELFDVNDEERENIILTVPRDAVEDRFMVVNHAVLEGVDYVYYDITEGVVTYSSLYKDKPILRKNIEEFDVIYQNIVRGKDKSLEKKLIYAGKNPTIKKYYPNEMANGSVMFNVRADVISLEDICDAIYKLYPGRVTLEKKGITPLGDEVLNIVYIDGIKFNLDEDLCWELVTISPVDKGNGEKYIFEIVDYLAREK